MVVALRHWHFQLITQSDVQGQPARNLPIVMQEETIPVAADIEAIGNGQRSPTGHTQEERSEFPPDWLTGIAFGRPIAKLLAETQRQAMTIGFISNELYDSPKLCPKPRTVLALLLRKNSSNVFN